MIEAEVNQLERGSAEGDRSVVVNGLVGNHHVRILDLLEAFLGSLVRDERGAGVLEGFAAGDVVEMVVAVNHVSDRLGRDLLDLVEIGRDRLWTSVADRVGGNHTCGRDYEHRLGVPVAEDVDVIGALDLGGRERRRLCLLLLLLRLGGRAQNRYGQRSP